MLGIFLRLLHTTVRLGASPRFPRTLVKSLGSGTDSLKFFQRLRRLVIIFQATTIKHNLSQLVHHVLFFSAIMLFSVVLLATLSPIVGAVPQGTNSYAPSRPLLSPPQACKPELTPGLYSKIRNGIIESIWRPEKQRVLSSSLSTPSEYREKYGKDVVLRFNITTPADVKALSRASDALGLDIWEANNEWADIRLAKERVGSSNALSSRLTTIRHNLISVTSDTTMCLGR